MAITYVCPVVKHSAGGIKVMYRHSEMLSSHGIASNVFHPENPKFTYTWFAHRANLREAKPYDNKKDFIVIPEIWAVFIGRYCLEKNIRYGIFVQNGYLINEGKGQGAEAELKNIYQSASLILSVSEICS